MNEHNFLIHRINRRIAERLPYHGRVIDLGCGKAPYRQHILERAESYIGVDWKNSAHSPLGADVFADLVQGFPFQDACADTVVAFQVLEHLPEPERFLIECHRILKPDGRLWLTVPFMWQIHEAPRDYFRFTRQGLEYLLGKQGFVEIDVQENTGFWQMWILKFNYHTRRFAPGPLKYAWLPFWALAQCVAVLLDRFDPGYGETASYTVAARKP